MKVAAFAALAYALICAAFVVAVYGALALALAAFRVLAVVS